MYKLVYLNGNGSLKAVIKTEEEFFQEYGELIKGYTPDLSKLRKTGALCHRQELDNQPLLYGMLGPFYDHDCIRYETQAAYNALSY